MAEEKLTIDADVAGFVKAKETVKHGLEEVEKKAEAVGRSASKAMDKVTASMNRAGKAGAGVSVAAGAGKATSKAGGSTAGTALGSLAGSAIAGRAGGAAVGRGLGGIVGSIAGPIGIVAGSLVGGLLADAVGGLFNSGEKGPSREEQRADAVGQLIARGFNQQSADSIARLGENIEAKFNISADRISDAVTEAKAGDASSLAGILKDVGIDPSSVNSANEALERLAAASNGAADKAEQAGMGEVDKAIDRLGKTGTGSFVKDFASGVARFPGELWANIKSGVANDINSVTDLLGGPAPQEPAKAVNPQLQDDIQLQKPRQRASAKTGDMRIVVSSPKSVPTVVKNMGGR